MKVNCSPQGGVWLRWEGGAPRPELHHCLPGWTLQWCRPGTSLSGGAQPTEPGVTGGRSPHHITALPRRGKQCIGSLAPKAGAILHLHQAKQSACGFPGEPMVKNLPARAGNAGDTSLIPGWGRSPGAGNGNPLQYSCLGNSMDRGAWLATVHAVAKSPTQLSTHA